MQRLYLCHCFTAYWVAPKSPAAVTTERTRSQIQVLNTQIVFKASHHHPEGPGEHDDFQIFRGISQWNHSSFTWIRLLVRMPVEIPPCGGTLNKCNWTWEHFGVAQENVARETGVWLLEVDTKEYKRRSVVKWMEKHCRFISSQLGWDAAQVFWFMLTRQLYLKKSLQCTLKEEHRWETGGRCGWLCKLQLRGYRGVNGKKAEEEEAKLPKETEEVQHNTLHFHHC